MHDAQTKLAALWADLLNCEEVTGDTDFFDCGGTSITAVHLAARIQETFGVSVDAIEVVVEKEFGKLARLLDSRLAAAAS
ncbi:phosphopantetheine-binding protein [Streptomyces sp. RB6PN25]|uniref:Phosphopantetheine-binding protein n=1 Tax=Streptomyces humicola TaxID=2953240 RepID=A0ABT1Q421_9ACTN|nr:phosphopantetheine-binding protein [Streptomyces humicola]MCQ4083497.1 phosphopantetheine-binding protein [Streptomyces humicola]